MQYKTLTLICLLYAGWLPVGILDTSELKCVTENYNFNQSRDYERNRQQRLLSFNNEEGSLKIELNFAIPFIQIPIGGKRSSTSTEKIDSHPVIDINTKSIVTAGAFVFAVLYIIPKILKLILPNSERLSKADDDTEFGRLTHTIETIMSGINLDADSCWQRTICSMIQVSSRKVNERRGSSWDKIIDGLARNNLLHTMIHGSSTYEGIMSGLKDNHCTARYKSCNFNFKDVISLIHKMAM